MSWSYNFLINLSASDPNSSNTLPCLYATADNITDKWNKSNSLSSNLKNGFSFPNDEVFFNFITS